MRILTAFTMTVLLATTASAAFAYQLKKPPDNTPCTADGSPCNVYCDDGDIAGTMYWNGSVWTDGVKFDRDEDAEARKIVAANGTSCT
jgi:hypothetical protein